MKITSKFTNPLRRSKLSNHIVFHHIVFHCYLLALSLIFICGSFSCSVKEIPKSQQEENLLKTANEALERELYSVAKESFLELIEKFPHSEHSEFAGIKAADSAFELKRYKESEKLYAHFAKIHPKSKYFIYAHSRIAEGRINRYSGLGKDISPISDSLKSLQELKEFSTSEKHKAAIEKMILECQEKMAEHETEVAKYYRKRGNIKASKARLAAIKENYPNTDIANSLKD